MASSHNAKLVSHIDCPGGGQVWVDGDTLYVGHMEAPSGTSIFDISDPRKPKALARIDLPQGWHSHKVRAKDGIMIVNHEAIGEGGSPDFGGGLAIYDVARPTAPKLITKWQTDGA
ncbi:MAG: hypothetical protein WCD67_21635, partial [Xanthobacteraceae bacterium]